MRRLVSKFALPVWPNKFVAAITLARRSAAADPRDIRIEQLAEVLDILRVEVIKLRKRIAPLERERVSENPTP